MHNHSHHHEHDHEHHHHHHHHHGPKNYNQAFAIGIALNTLFVLIEGGYGFFANSLALMADAGHNLSDVAGLLIAWAAFWLTNRRPSTHFTFGLSKSSILSALFNAIFLLVAVGIILWEAIHRLLRPSLVDSKVVMIVAAIGIVVNTLTALLFFRDKNDDINIRGAYLHMAADAVISLGVVISAVLINYTSWNWIDPMVSILISCVIIYGTWDLLRDSVRLSLDAVPEGIDPIEVKKYLENLTGVKEAHDLHIWAMSTTQTALSVHLSLEHPTVENAFLLKITEHLKHHFHINHPTIQLEHYSPDFECHLKSEEVL